VLLALAVDLSATAAPPPIFLWLSQIPAKFVECSSRPNIFRCKIQHERNWSRLHRVNWLKCILEWRQRVFTCSGMSIIVNRP